MFVRIMLALSLALTAAACSKDEGATCPRVVDHQISAFSLPKPSAEERTEMLQKCEKIPTKARECLLKASTIEAVQTCRTM